MRYIVDIKSPKLGEIAFNKETGQPFKWNGLQWVALQPIPNKLDKRHPKSR